MAVLQHHCALKALLITSVHNPAIKLIRSLAGKKQRTEHGLFLAEGGTVLQRARHKGWTPDYVLSTGHAESWGEAAMLRVDAKIMSLISAQSNPPDQVGVFRQRWTAGIEPRGIWVALEELRDPGNLGTIIRTADAAGASGIILIGHSCDPWGPDCVRATMGSIFGVPLVRMSLDGFLDFCRTWRGEIVGTDLKATENYRRPYQPPTLLVMGSEGRGLSDATAAACTILVRIPMKASTQSLNVAIATALMLYEAATPELSRDVSHFDPHLLT